MQYILRSIFRCRNNSIFPPRIMRTPTLRVRTFQLSKSNQDVSKTNTVDTSTKSKHSCGSEPDLVRGLEQKTIDDVKDLHVDAVDDDVSGPYSWKNPNTGEIGGPKGALRNAEPTRFGDWELNGCSYHFF